MRIPGCKTDGRHMACRRPILSDSVVFGEDDTGLEQVAVHLETELAALEIGQALGDGEPQSAALSGPGIVPSDEALEQLLGGEVEGVGGDVLHCQDRATST